MVVAILAAIAQIADIVVKFTAKKPETIPALAPIVGSLISAASQAAGETPQETAARMAAHDAVVTKWGAMGPLNQP